MTGIIARIKLLPDDASLNPEELLSRIKNTVKGVGEVKAHKVEPIAFGLNALIVDFVIQDAEGGTDPLEERLSKVSGLGSFEVIGVSRASTKL
ncbi:MAG: elongation factor 1-beta [Conexivisphaerales archaeon]